MQVDRSKKHTRGRTTLLLSVVCLLLGLIAISQYKSLQKTKEQVFVEGKTNAELASDYIILYEKNMELHKRYDELTLSISELYSARDNEAVLEDLMQAELEATQRMAGLLPVEGEGITVVIDQTQSVPITSNMLIQFVNELKASGATAVAINDQRVVAMTEIRDTYTGFSVNGIVFNYGEEITLGAIGNSADIYNALSMVGGILDKWGDSNIDVSVDIVENLIVPALDPGVAERMQPPVPGRDDEGSNTSNGGT